MTETLTASDDQLAGPTSKRRRLIPDVACSSSIQEVPKLLAAGVSNDQPGHHRQVREDRRAIIRDIYTSYCALHTESTISVPRDVSLFKSLLALASGNEIVASHLDLFC